MKTIHQNIDYHFRAANYLTCAQLFLRDNILLRKRFKFNDLEPVVLGHWGACPAINFLYAHFCRYIQITNSRSYLILGSGHAAPALLANLYLERSLGKIYPDLDYGIEGIHNLVSKFGIDPRLQTEISSALQRIFSQETNPKNIIVVCTGYINIFRGLFGGVYDTKNWRFLGYKNGFSLNQNASVLELNEVNKESLIKYIKNQLHLSP